MQNSTPRKSKHKRMGKGLIRIWRQCCTEAAHWRLRYLCSRGLLALVLGVLPLGLCAQNVNPQDESFRLQVSQLQLVVPEGQQVPGLQQRLQVEQARFGTWVTVDELHTIADALTLYLRQQGYVFHTVFLPPQRVEGGVVQLRLQPGVLTDVHVINHSKLADRRFQAPFRGLMGGVLYGPQVEEKVQALKAQGGFRVFAFYSRGRNPGEATLNLRVDPAEQRHYSVRVDNYGSPASGEYRLIAQYSEYQLTGRHDRLSVAALYALDDVDNLYGSLSYHLPFGALKYAWDISASNNQFTLGDRFAALGLQGDATILRTGLTATTRHRAEDRSAWRLGVQDKRSNVRLSDDADNQPGEGANRRLSDEHSRALSLQWSRSLQWAESATALTSVIEYAYGDAYVQGLPDTRFHKLDYSGLWVRAFAQQRGRSLLQLSLRGQYADTALPSVDAFALTGAFGVRAYEPGLFSADRAVLAALEWRMPRLLTPAESQWGLEPFAFADWSRGDKYQQSAPMRKATFSGAGLGLRGHWQRRLQAQLSAAWPVRGEVGGTEVDKHEQIRFEIRWH